MRLLTGENGPGFCKLSKSRIDGGRNGDGLELVTVAGGVPAGLRRWLLSGWLRAGFDAFMTWAAIRQASGRKSSLFRPLSLSPCLPSLSGCPRVLLLALSVRSGWAGWRQGRRVHLAGVLGVSCSPAAWGRACRSRAVSAGRLSC